MGKIKGRRIFEYVVTIAMIFFILSSKNVYGEIIEKKRDIKIVGVTDKYIFYEEARNISLYRMDKDGNNKTFIAKSMDISSVIKGDWIYYVRKGNRLDSLIKMKLDGSEKEIIISGQMIGDFSIVEEYIYIIMDQSKNLYRMNLEGNNKEKIFSDNVWKIYNTDKIEENSNSVYFATRYKYIKYYKIHDSEELNIEKIYKETLMNVLTEDTKGEKIRDGEYEYFELEDGQGIGRKQIGKIEDDSLWRINEEFRVNIKKNEKFYLPQSISFLFNNGEKKNVQVKWNKQDLKTERVGQYFIKGIIEDTEESVEMAIQVGDIDSIEDLIQALRKKKENLYFSNIELENYYLNAKKIVDNLIEEGMSEVEKELKVIQLLSEIKISKEDINRPSEIYEEGEIRSEFEVAVFMNIAGVETYVVRDGGVCWNVVKIDDKMYNLNAFNSIDYIEQSSFGNIFEFNVRYDLKGVKHKELDENEATDDRFKEFDSAIGMLAASNNKWDAQEEESYIYKRNDYYILFKFSKKDGSQEKLLDAKIQYYAINGDKIQYMKLHDKRKIYENNLINPKEDVIYEAPQGLEIKDMHKNGDRLVFVLCKEIYAKEIEGEGIYLLNLESKEADKISDSRVSEIISKEDWCYFSDKDKDNILYRINFGSKKIERQSYDSSDDIHFYKGNVRYTSGGAVYYYNFHEGTWNEVAKNGRFRWLDPKNACTLLGEKLYYTDLVKGELNRVDKTEREVIQIKQDNKNEFSIVKEKDGKLYLLDKDFGVKEFDPETGSIKKFSRGNPLDFSVVDDWIYYIYGNYHSSCYSYKSNYNYGLKIYRINKKSLNSEEILTEGFELVKITHKFLYYNDKKNLYRLDLESREIKTISETCSNFDVDEKNLYFIEQNGIFGKSVYMLDEEGVKTKISRDYVLGDMLKVIENDLYYLNEETNDLVCFNLSDKSSKILVEEVFEGAVDIRVNEKHLLIIGQYQNQYLHLDRISGKEKMTYLRCQGVRLFLTNEGIYAISGANYEIAELVEE